MADAREGTVFASVLEGSQNMIPPVSIVVPVHNGVGCIERCLESIEAQTFRDFEIVCVDDGSTDGTLGALEDLQARWGNVRVLSKDRGGVSSARNSGMAEARGRYLLFVDADDAIEPDLLEETLSVANTTGAHMTIFGFSECYEGASARVPREMCSQENLQGRSFALSELADTSTTLVTPNVWRILFDRRFLEENGLSFHEDLQTSEDLAFIYEALLCSPRIALVDKRLYLYSRDNSTTLTRSERGVAGLQALEHIRRFGEERGGFDDAAMRHFVNLVLDTLRYALSTAYSAGEFQALYDGYQREWAALVSAHEEAIAPRYRAFYGAMFGGAAEYLFGLYSQERSQLENTRAQLAAARDELESAVAANDGLRATVRRLEQKPFNRFVRWAKRVVRGDR